MDSNTPADPSLPGGKISQMSEEEDRLLMVRIAAKETEAFECLYRRYAPRIARFASRFLKEPADLEEVINDVLLVVWQQAEHFDAAKRCSTWIFGIAHYKALKAYTKRAKVWREQSGDVPDVADAADNAETVLIHSEQTHGFTRALETLSPEHRAVIDLTFQQGLAYHEIAEIVGCPVNTVKTRMFYARRRLAQVLASWDLRESVREPGEGS